MAENACTEGGGKRHTTPHPPKKPNKQGWKDRTKLSMPCNCYFKDNNYILTIHVHYPVIMLNNNLTVFNSTV